MLAAKAMRHRWSPATQTQSLIVAGCQRSGTNMVMNMLERHSQTKVYHERDTRAYEDYVMRDLSIIESLHAQCKAERFVVKALCELHMLAEIRNCLKPARLIWVVRSWPDVANSMIRSFSGFRDHLGNIAKDRHSAGWRGLGMSNETLAVVREVDARSPDEISSAALQWYFRNILLFENALDQDGDVYILNYEKLVSHPETCIRSICDFVGIDYEPRMLGNISPRSIGKNNSPMVDTRVAQVCDDLQQRLLSVCR